MTSEKVMLACLRKADFDYGLIEKGDKILLGLSGGKDSMSLAKLLTIYQHFEDKDFTFVAAFMDLGFPDPDIEGLKKYAEKTGFELKIIDARDVGTILRAHRQTDGLLPCSICSRMKKAVINKAAKQMGITKVAFAHHADDAIETLFMNMTYGGRVATFEPKMHLDKENITFIRPLIYAREKDITRYAKEHQIPVIKNNCGNDKKTEREDFKELLQAFYKNHPTAYDNFLTLLTNQEAFQLFFDKIGYAFGDGTFLKKVESAKNMDDCFYIRKEVFVKEQNVPIDDEIDGKDRQALQFLLLKDNKPVGTMRVFINTDERTAHFGRVAILKEYRGLGLGEKMVSQVMKIISRRIAPIEIQLEAQTHAVGFYEKLGFSKVDDKTFLDAGIEHCNMARKIVFPIPDKEKLHS
jgi:tRNA 2-thiocytidine biosynthesis protein TtcA